jgi:hypothetical protein
MIKINLGIYDTAIIMPAAFVYRLIISLLFHRTWIPVEIFWRAFSTSVVEKTSRNDQKVT